MRRILVVLAALVAVGGVAGWYVLVRDTAAPAASIDAIDAAGSDTGYGGPRSADGTWTVVADESVFVGYRVQEQFVGDVVEKTATGRTPAVEGTVTVDGSQVTAASFTADLTQLSSDQARRDSALRTRGLETDLHPTATFELTTPITLPAAPARGSSVEVTANGDLTLHGRTAPIGVRLEARWDGPTISIAGSTEVAFADFAIAPIEIPGFVKTADHGTLELQLLLEPAA